MRSRVARLSDGHSEPEARNDLPQTTSPDAAAKHTSDAQQFGLWQMTALLGRSTYPWGVLLCLAKGCSRAAIRERKQVAEPWPSQGRLAASLAEPRRFGNSVWDPLWCLGLCRKSLHPLGGHGSGCAPPPCSATRRRFSRLGKRLDSGSIQILARLQNSPLKKLDPSHPAPPDKLTSQSWSRGHTKCPPSTQNHPPPSQAGDPAQVLPRRRSHSTCPIYLL
jgi:hypothetical protein